MGQTGAARIGRRGAPHRGFMESGMDFSWSLHRKNERPAQSLSIYRSVWWGTVRWGRHWWWHRELDFCHAAARTSDRADSVSLAGQSYVRRVYAHRIYRDAALSQ